MLTGYDECPDGQERTRRAWCPNCGDYAEVEFEPIEDGSNRFITVSFCCSVPVDYHA